VKISLVGMRMANKLKRTGPIREGLDYQDACALMYMVHWLEHPSDYEWMLLEADEFGYLDDIVIAHGERRLSLIRVLSARLRDLC